MLLWNKKYLKKPFGIVFTQSMNTKITTTVYYCWSGNFCVSFGRVRNDEESDAGLRSWWADLLCTARFPQRIRQALRQVTVSSPPASVVSL